MTTTTRRASTPSPRRRTTVRTLLLATAGAFILSGPAGGQSRTLIGRAIAERSNVPQERTPHALQDNSLFAVAEDRPRVFKPHDLVQIIVQETSRAASSQELETTKESTIDGSISAFPDLNLSDIAQLQLFAGRTTGLPSVGIDLEKEFSGEGDYQREDDFSTRITAEVLEVLPNGNLILEARTQVQNDAEVTTITVSGVCRGIDVTARNTVLSNQVHDLVVRKKNEGELPKAAKKGIVTQFFEALFAF